MEAGEVHELQRSLAPHSVAHRPAATSSGSLLEMESLRSQPRPLSQHLPFNLVPRLLLLAFGTNWRPNALGQWFSTLTTLRINEDFSKTVTPGLYPWGLMGVVTQTLVVFISSPSNSNVQPYLVPRRQTHSLFCAN